jgi:UDPglucose 6-dehydrogenase
MIAVIGLGKVGLPLVAAILQANYKVLGIDNNKKLVQELVNGINNCPEKKVARIVKKYNSNIQFNSDFCSCKKKTIFFLIVPTPSNLDNSFANTYVINAVKNILKYSEKKKIYILLNSTLSPGSIDKIIIPYIKKNKKKGSTVEFIYNPLFIALGNVFEGITDPMSVLLGYNKINFPRNIYNIFSRILKRKKINFFYLSYKEAEIAKLVSNCIDTTRVSFANLIGLICNDSKNTNSDKINFFLNSRVSNRINHAGTPYGGPCWPRDNRALAFSMKKKLNNFNLIPNSVHKFNDLYTSYLIKKTATIIKKKNKIILFGIGYKNGTDEIVESFSYKLFKFLKNKKKTIKVFNENKNHSNKNIFNYANIEYFDYSNTKNLLNFQVIILAHRKLFINFNTFKKLLKKNIIIVDYWRLYDYRHANYYTFG